LLSNHPECIIRLFKYPSNLSEKPSNRRNCVTHAYVSGFEILVHKTYSIYAHIRSSVKPLLVERESYFQN